MSRTIPAVFVVRSSYNVSFHYLTKSGSITRYDETFYGVMVDTGCVRGIIGGKTQNLAYCCSMEKEPTIDESRATTCHFGIGSGMSQGMASVEFPLENMWFSFGIHVFTSDMTILF